MTFNKIDPFFVFELPEDSKPFILGYFKIPGFSTYLHPYDENTLIGLGRITRWNGELIGIKVSLIDYSDPTNPKQLKNYTEENPTYASIAESDHKAFQFNFEKKIMVIPGTGTFETS